MREWPRPGDRVEVKRCLLDEIVLEAREIWQSAGVIDVNDNGIAVMFGDGLGPGDREWIPRNRTRDQHYRHPQPKETGDE